MPEPEFTATEEFLPAGPDDVEQSVGQDEFVATGVHIERGLRSLTRAGQVRVRGGLVELLNSGGRVIAAAPAERVRVLRKRFGRADRVLVELGGTRYRLTLRDEDADLGPSGAPGPSGPAAASGASAVSGRRTGREAGRRTDGGDTPGALLARTLRLAARPH
jgi:hypothetical protein